MRRHFKHHEYSSRHDHDHHGFGGGRHNHHHDGWVHPDDMTTITIGDEDDNAQIIGDGDDVVTGSDDNEYIKTGAGNDQVNSGAGDDAIKAGDGDDQLDGGDGSDWISGGNGDDVIAGGEGNNFLYGGAGDDDISAGTGDDVLKGGSGNDRLEGGDGNDILMGSGHRHHHRYGSSEDETEEVDALYGGAGDDRIYVGKADVEVYGGDGSDVFVMSAGLGHHRCFDVEDEEPITNSGGHISDFEVGVDKIELKGAEEGGTLALLDGVATYTEEDGDSFTFTIDGEEIDGLSLDDFIF